MLRALIDVLEAETVVGECSGWACGTACAQPVNDVALLANDVLNDGEFFDELLDVIEDGGVGGFADLEFLGQSVRDDEMAWVRVRREGSSTNVFKYFP